MRPAHPPTSSTSALAWTQRRPGQHPLPHQASKPAPNHMPPSPVVFPSATMRPVSPLHPRPSAIPIRLDLSRVRSLDAIHGGLTALNLGQYHRMFSGLPALT